MCIESRLDEVQCQAFSRRSQCSTSPSLHKCLFCEHIHEQTLLTLCDIRASSGLRSVSRPEAFCSSSLVLIHPRRSSSSHHCLQKDCMHQHASIWCMSLCIQYMCSMALCDFMRAIWCTYIYHVFRITVTQTDKYLVKKLMMKKRQLKTETQYAFILLVCVYLPSCLVTCLPLPRLPIPNPPGSWLRALCSRSPWSLSQQPADQPKDAWCNSLHQAGPSIADPVVRDKVLSCRKGWQINFNSDWWASWGRETSV